MTDKFEKYADRTYKYRNWLIVNRPRHKRDEEPWAAVNPDRDNYFRTETLKKAKEAIDKINS